MSSASCRQAYKPAPRACVTRSRPAVYRLHLACVEALDPRRLLASAVLNGIELTVEGTAGDDVIIVGANKRFVNLLTVSINDQPAGHFSLGALRHVVIQSGEGDDKIWIDSALDSLALGARVNSGAGNDIVTTGSGFDEIETGDGNDKVYANGGDDVIGTGGGRDSVWAGAGSDVVGSGAGNDRLAGEAGNDTLDSAKGNDEISAGDGDDTLYDAGGTNRIDCGAGNDVGAKIVGGGVIYAGAGNDVITAVGGAILYGQEDNDHLQAWWLDGGSGSDTLSGLDGNDEIHGGDGDDLIRGFAGDDVLLGDDGSDALFGGGGTDSLFAGAGDDNLYGTDGHLDARKKLAGNDQGYGQAGADWFETDYRWSKADRDAADRPVASQNPLAHDPSEGAYLGGSFIVGSASGATTSYSSVDAGTNRGGGKLTVAPGNYAGGAVDIATGGTTAAVTMTTTSLGPAGWLSSGAYNTSTEEFVPPPLSRTERLKAERLILEIPKGWHLGSFTAARDDVLWYQVWRDGATPPAPSGVGEIVVGGGSITVSPIFADSYFGNRIVRVTKPAELAIGDTFTDLPVGTYRWNGGTLVPFEEQGGGEPMHAVPTIGPGTTSSPGYAIGATTVAESTPHLYDGVADGKYRFLGVKRGTILVGGSASTATEAKWKPLHAPLLVLPNAADLRIAGDARTFETSIRYDATPPAGPKLRGIAVDGGAIWLPTDGSAPYFSSGKS